MAKRGVQAHGVTGRKTLWSLVIVARSRARLYAYLKRAFADIDAIRVILDERSEDQKQHNKPFTPERRRQTHRRIDDQLSEVGCAFVSLGDFPELTAIRGELLDALAQHPKIYGVDWRIIAVVLGSSSPFNARRIATLLRIDYGSVKRSVRKLVGFHILQRTPAGLVFQPQSDRWERREPFPSLADSS